MHLWHLGEKDMKKDITEITQEEIEKVQKFVDKEIKNHFLEIGMKVNNVKLGSEYGEIFKFSVLRTYFVNLIAVYLTNGSEYNISKFAKFVDELEHAIENHRR
jgi:hypothetical protein